MLLLHNDVQEKKKKQCTRPVILENRNLIVNNTMIFVAVRWGLEKAMFWVWTKTDHKLFVISVDAGGAK